MQLTSIVLLPVSFPSRLFNDFFLCDVTNNDLWFGEKAKRLGANLPFFGRKKKGNGYLSTVFCFGDKIKQNKKESHLACFEDFDSSEIQGLSIFFQAGWQCIRNYRRPFQISRQGKQRRLAAVDAGHCQ